MGPHLLFNYSDTMSARDVFLFTHKAVDLILLSQPLRPIQIG